MDSKSKIKAREATTRTPRGYTVSPASWPRRSATRRPWKRPSGRGSRSSWTNPGRGCSSPRTRLGSWGVSFWIKPDLAHGDTVVEVPMLVVAEDHRRAGVGKLLMEEVRNVASDNDASQIELVATRANVTAREFYRSRLRRGRRGLAGVRRISGRPARRMILWAWIRQRSEVVSRPEHDSNSRAEEHGPQPSDLLHLREP